MNQRIAFIFTLIFIFILSAKAQNFVASTNKKQVGVGEDFVVYFKIESEDGDHFTPPANLDLFEVMSGPNISSVMSNDNGQISASTTYSFVLVGTNVGKFTLGAARIWLNGNPISSNTIDIEVVAGKGGGASAASVQATPAPNNANISPEMREKLAKGIFLEARPDKKEAYIGEQIYLCYRIYAQLPFGQPRQIDAPLYEGFWVEDLKPGVANSEIANVNGKNYRIFDVKKSFLYPQKAGALQIPTFRLQTSVEVETHRQPKNIWEHFFGKGAQVPDLVEEVPYMLESKPLTINIKPLPEKGKPLSFTGAVGSFSMQMACDKKTVPSGEPFEITLTFQGEGNLKMVEAPKLNLSPSFEVETPENEDDIQKSTENISGIRTFRYRITPTKEGNFEIPPINFSFFNPKTERYDSLQSAAFSLKVTQGANTAANGKAETAAFKEIHTNSGGISPLSEPFLGKWSFLGVYMSLLLSFVSWVVYRKKKEENQPDALTLQVKNAHQVANTHLLKAKIFLDKQENKAFYKEVSTSIWGYLADKLKLKTSDLSRENIATELEKYKIEKNIVSQLVQILDECEMALFAPFSNEQGMKLCYENAQKMIQSLEENIGKEKLNA